MLRLRGRSPRRRPVGRPRRPRGEPSVERGHHRPGRIHDEGRYRDLRPPAGAARRAGSGRPGGRVLAGVRRAGKEQIPVRWLLSHQAGLPVIDGPLTFEEACAWDPVIRALEAQKPLWQPGTEHLYHAHHLRVPGRGARAADLRQVARHLLRRRGRCPARAERLDRAARGAGGDGWPGSSTPPFSVEELTAGMIEATGLDADTVTAWIGRSFGPGLGSRPRRRARRRLRSHQRLLQHACLPGGRVPLLRTWSRTLDRWHGCMRPR